MKLASVFVWFVCFFVGMALSAREMDVEAQTFLLSGIGYLLLAMYLKD